MYLIYSVEDDKDISKIINKTLSNQGYEVKSFYNGVDFLNYLKTKKPDIILLDMMLPDIKGQTILKLLRDDSNYDDVDIIIVSANNMTIDKVDGLDLGADDYIEKPFDLLELISRVNAKLRKRNKKNIIKIKDVIIDFNKMEITRENSVFSITSKENQVLEYLLQNKSKVIKREELLDKIWQSKDIETRALDMHIKSLREKLGDNIIKTIHGVGYIIE